MSAGYRKAMLESEIQKVLTEALRNFKGESEIRSYFGFYRENRAFKRQALR